MQIDARTCTEAFRYVMNEKNRSSLAFHVRTAEPDVKKKILALGTEIKKKAKNTDLSTNTALAMAAYIVLFRRDEREKCHEKQL